MPYTIKKFKNGYKVCKKDDSKCFSNEPLTKENATKQLQAIVISEQKKGGYESESDYETSEELSGGLKPITARVGGKVLLKKKIVNEYFPSSNTYSTYVEPFVGGGSIYFFKNKDDHKEVVNDIDPDIYVLFKGLQKYDAKKIADDINGDYTQKEFDVIKESDPDDAYNKFLRTYLLYKLSYFGRGLSFGKPRVNTSFEGYKERLKDVDILKEDYRDVIRKYNKKDTFFYLDPPVKESQGKFYFPAVDIPDLVKILRTIKGKFLLSLADTSIDKELFKPFTIVTIPTKYVGEKTRGGQTMAVNEYLIMNYTPKLEGGTHRTNVLKEYDLENKGHSLEELSKKSSVPLDILQQVYNRGVGAYKTNPTSVRLKGSYVKNVDAPMSKKLSKEQWGMARVYSFLDGNPKHDNDLRGGLKMTDDSVIIPKKEFIKEHTELVNFFKKEAKDQGEELKKVKGGCKGCMGACGGSMVKFHKQLKEVGLTHDIYMSKAKELAKASGYDPKALTMCEDEDHKLTYKSPDGDVNFGKVGYSDYIIYSWLEKQGEVPKGEADKRRKAYRARAENIKGNWRDNKYSPNNLAINILW